MRKTKYVQILRETARDYDGELWSFLPGDELRVEGIDMLEDPPTVPLSVALDLINKRDATALAVRDVGADLDEVREVYREMEGKPGVNTTLALLFVFAALARRFDEGERTLELYDEMVGVK